MTRNFHVVIVMLALAIAPAAAHAQADTSTSAQHEGVTGLIGTCEGEASVVTDGAVTTVFHTTTDAAGGTHLVVHDVFRLPGTGAVTGDRYLWMRNGTFVVNSGAATTVRNGGHELNLAQGTGDDASQQTVFHTTETANGDTTGVVTLERDDECG